MCAGEILLGTRFGKHESTARVRFDDDFGIMLGLQANGIALVSEILVNPSMQPDDILRFRIQQGQIVTFPLNKKGFIVTSQRLNIVLSHTVVPTIESLGPIPNKVTLDKSTRIDIDPC